MVNLQERFISKIDVSDGRVTSCWLWKESTNGVGYGMFRVNKIKVLSHRYSYELFIGKIPKGLVIDHLCRNVLCVNPTHLEAITQKENIRRGVGNGSQTHCKRGHEFTKDNIYNRPDRIGRVCKQCRKILEDRRRLK